MSHGKQHVNILQRENKQNILFSALIRLNPAPDRLGRNQKSKVISVKILQINRICIFSALVQSDPAPERVESNHRQRVIFVDATKAIVLSCLERKLAISCHLCYQHQTLNCWVQLRKFFTSLKDLQDPFQEEMLIHLSDMCSSQEQKTIKFS